MLLMLVGAAVADEALRERLKKAWDDSEKQFQEDMSGDLGHGAIALCRARLGIKEPVKNGMEIINRGYGSDRAIAFAQCVTDTMYPMPAEK